MRALLRVRWLLLLMAALLVACAPAAQPAPTAAASMLEQGRLDTAIDLNTLLATEIHERANKK